MLRPALQSNQSSLCGFHRSGDLGGGGPNGQTFSIKKKKTEEGGEAGKSSKREKSTEQRMNPCGTPQRTRKKQFL